MRIVRVSSPIAATLTGPAVGIGVGRRACLGYYVQMPLPRSITAADCALFCPILPVTPVPAIYDDDAVTVAYVDMAYFRFGFFLLVLILKSSPFIKILNLCEQNVNKKL